MTMKVLSRLIVAGCLVCAAPLVQACEPGQQGVHGGSMIKEMDKNGDGAISKKEFDAFHSAHFKEMDTNSDGKITRDEMDAVHKKMMDKCNVSFDRHFDESDINHDGALSKDEAEIGMPMLFKHFDEIDTNKDGKISKEELTESMKKMHDKMQGNRGEGMMKRNQQ
jgi:Ca2+-binding EF-hand superfamily protein